MRQCSCSNSNAFYTRGNICGPKLHSRLVCMRMYKGAELLYGNIRTLQYWASLRYDNCISILLSHIFVIRFSVTKRSDVHQADFFLLVDGMRYAYHDIKSAGGVSAPEGVCSWGGLSAPEGCLLLRGVAWWRSPPGRPLLRAVRILLECILVLRYVHRCYLNCLNKSIATCDTFSDSLLK